MHFKKLPVLKIEHINKDYFVLGVRDKELTQKIKPGHFFQVKDPASRIPLLPRPFSVYKVDNDELEFLVKIIGEATMKLSHLSTGQDIQLLGPLGNGFPLVSGKKVLLASGGIGFAPMPFLEHKLKEAGNEVHFYHGGRSSNDVFCDSVENCTDDGTFGHTGFVTEYVEKYLDSTHIDIVYACGPEPMMKTLTIMCSKRDIPIYVSMERVMACGVGACCGCVIKIKENDSIVYKKVCNDGPVFYGAEVVWDA
ncbi:MAG: dihydroorotate dehydrogenase electron transfer subunit [Candidatus Cloacimonetes bacterium]|nr:dihydroorotate dehydrogenase electron transfer subunit [Candidatus Cloacimonadota bacterium]